MTSTRVLVLFAIAAGLGACDHVPKPSSATGAASAGNEAPPRPLVPAAVPEPEPAPTPVVATPQQRQQAQAAAYAAVHALQSGNEQQAKTDVERALALDAGNKLANSLRRQIAEDPLAMLGRESFAYTVKPSESMSGLAGRFLNDVYLFYALARYNGIAVPQQLAAGQTLRIPGKAQPSAAAPATNAPVAVASPAPTPAPAPLPPPEPAPPAPTAGEAALRAGEAAERAGDVDRALAEYRKAAAADQPGAASGLERLLKQQVSRHSVAARTALAKQDLDGAIKNWTRVLQLEPGNDVAKLELQRCRALKEKMNRLPGTS